MVEIGVCKGDFALPLLEQCQFLERYYMIDPLANLPDRSKAGSEFSFIDVTETDGDISLKKLPLGVGKGRVRQMIERSLAAIRVSR